MGLLRRLLILILGGLGPAMAAPPPDREPDWHRLRRDLEGQAQEWVGKGEFAARRQALRERARARFAATDLDGDGYWSREEMGRALPGLIRHFDRIDTNGDGRLSEPEMIRALRMRRRMQDIPMDRGPVVPPIRPERQPPGARWRP